MLPAFAITAPFPSCRQLSASKVKRPPSYARVSMASVSRPQQKSCVIDFDDVPSTNPVPAEIAAITATVCEFMNQEHVRDLANYIIRFGNKFDNLSQLSAVRLTSLDAVGFTADVISCDDTSHCVCIQERLEWPLGLCHNAGDIISAFKHLSMLCGLPADF